MDEKLNVMNIGKYIKLKKQGNNYIANCPFHDEDTPSFIVSPEKNIWKCFGCGLGGDFVKFVSLYKNISYSEAYYEITGIKSKNFKEKTKTEEINEILTEFYNAALVRTNFGEVVVKEIEERKISLETMKEFKIGLAYLNNPSYTLLSSNDFNDDDIKKTKHYNLDKHDTFQNRIMFPIVENNRVKGFVGRTLNKNSNFCKYLNSKESEIFKKSELFFGFDNSFEYINKEDSVFIVEGVFDYLTLFQSGVKNVLATLGLNLSAEHLNKISKLTKNIILMYDNDKAGQNAIIKASILAKEMGFNVKIVLVEKGKDINEILVKFDKKEVLKQVQKQLNIYNYLFLTKKDDKKFKELFFTFLNFEENEIIVEKIKILAQSLKINTNILLKEYFEFSTKKEKMAIHFLANKIFKDYTIMDKIKSIFNFQTLSKEEHEILNSAFLGTNKGIETNLSLEDILFLFLKSKFHNQNETTDKK